MSEWAAKQLTELVQLRYPDWTESRETDFWQNEVGKSKQASEAFRVRLEEVQDESIKTLTDADHLLQGIKEAVDQTNWLWKRPGHNSDIAILQLAKREGITLAQQFWALLKGSTPSDERLREFARFAQQMGHEGKWPLPTYLLWLANPQTELLVKPQLTSWMLKFAGQPQLVSNPVDNYTYNLARQTAVSLLAHLSPVHVQDMIDLVCLNKVAMQENKRQIGKLDIKGQIDLDVPPTPPAAIIDTEHQQTAVFHESTDSRYKINAMTTPYSFEQLTKDTFYPPKTVQEWLSIIERKGQVIFYGPPGTGKTYLCQKLSAYLSSQYNTPSAFIQFHPTYAYEDFLGGIRPFSTPDGFTYQFAAGRLMQFCQQAAAYTAPCPLIIDEINRANIPAVLGETMSLLEYRDKQIQLANGQLFQIPRSVRILATMNTADRSIALIDHALRRRFALILLTPNYQLINRFHQNTTFDPAPLIKILTQINDEIEDPRFHIGHTYFLDSHLPANLKTIWQTEIEPYLLEYFFDSPSLISRFKWENIAKNMTND